MGFCKEKICNPPACRVPCDTGKELRSLFKASKCGETCVWNKQGINGKNPCKDVSCPIENLIVDFKKMKPMKY